MGSIFHSRLADLQEIVYKHHHDFPKDPRTICSTPKNVDVILFYNKHYCHFGVRSEIIKLLKASSNFGSKASKLKFY